MTCLDAIVRLMLSWDESLRRLHGSAPTISDVEERWVYDTQAALRDFDESLDNTHLAAEQVTEWLASKFTPGRRKS